MLKFFSLPSGLKSLARRRLMLNLVLLATTIHGCAVILHCAAAVTVAEPHAVPARAMSTVLIIPIVFDDAPSKSNVEKVISDEEKHGENIMLGAGRCDLIIRTSYREVIRVAPPGATRPVE